MLAAYLDDICQIANQRLLAMSSGRYTLAVHRDRAKGAAKSGLDLRVRDAHSGEEREVQSLSGGETFQASLALALAVAESVQQHAGGVHLDTLFIDEGFGTLDPDSLDLAMDELDKLRAGGRMVGIISHVGAPARTHPGRHRGHAEHQGLTPSASARSPPPDPETPAERRSRSADSFTAGDGVPERILSVSRGSFEGCWGASGRRRGAVVVALVSGPGVTLPKSRLSGM